MTNSIISLLTLISLGCVLIRLWIAIKERSNDVNGFRDKVSDVERLIREQQVRIQAQVEQITRLENKTRCSRCRCERTFRFCSHCGEKIPFIDTLPKVINTPETGKWTRKVYKPEGISISVPDYMIEEMKRKNPHA